MCFYCGFFGHQMKQCPHLSAKLEEDKSLSAEEISRKMQDKTMERYMDEIRAYYKCTDDGFINPNRNRPMMKKTMENSQRPLITGDRSNGDYDDTRHLQINLAAQRMEESNGQEKGKQKNSVENLSVTTDQGKSAYKPRIMVMTYIKKSI